MEWGDYIPVKCVIFNTWTWGEGFRWDVDDRAGDGGIWHEVSPTSFLVLWPVLGPYGGVRRAWKTPTQDCIDTIQSEAMNLIQKDPQSLG